MTLHLTIEYKTTRQQQTLMWMMLVFPGNKLHFANGMT